MSMRVYTPEADTPPKIGLVYYNQLGASTHEDAGRDAMHLAETLGVIVMAVERPGSGRSLPIHGKRLREDYIGAVAEQGKAIAIEADRHGLESVITSGRSAGGLAALALACTETVPIIGVTAKEPVGMYETTVRKGSKDYKAYLEQQDALEKEARNDPDSKLVLPEATDRTGIAFVQRALSIAYCATVDQLNNKNAWAQPLARDAALHIARDMPQIRAEMLFAQYSMVASPEQILPLADETQLLRAEASLDNDDCQPFTIRTIPGTIHGSFDLRRFYQTQDERFLAELGVTPSAANS